jgi:glutathione S-transferase
MLRLVIANLNYSSWSMRAWLGLRLTGAEFKLFDVGMFTEPGWKERILSFSGAGKVPILVEGPSTVHESLAILETFAERFPQAGLWPKDAALRARARAVSAEMASGFLELRSRMPANLRARASARPSGAALEQEIARVCDIVSASISTSPGEFLFGEFGIADCMYMPVLSRFRTYGVELPPTVVRYSDVVFQHRVVRELEEIARTTESVERYDAYLK